MVCMSFTIAKSAAWACGTSGYTPPRKQFSAPHYCHSLTTAVWGRRLYYCTAHFSSECMFPPFNPGLREGGEAGREGGLLFREDAAVCYWPRRWRARDTFSVITCLHVSAESQGFSHCFLSGLIWWMLSGTQHVSSETSWKSGGHWRHLKGLSEACLSCPGNVFHRGCLLFSFAFFPPSPVSPVFVHYKLLFSKAASLVTFLTGDNNEINIFSFCWYP